MRTIATRALRPAAPLLLAAALAGCFFAPREPQPPDTSEQIDYLDRDLPRKVWDNMQTSLRNTHAPGWEDAILQEGGTILPQFVYEPDGEAAGQFGDVLAGWDATKEIDFIRTFYGTNPQIEVVLRDPGFIPPNPSGTSVEWESVIYDLTVTDAGGAVNRYRGSADILFELVGNFWYVARWRDIQGERDPDDPGGSALPTMGVLRGTIASN